MLGAKTLFGAGWSVLTRTSGRAIDFVTLLVLARILTPADFGLTAIAVSIISIIDMVLEVPLVQALTRLRAVDKDHLDTAFTLGILRGGAIGLLLAAAAWPVAEIYADSRLAWLVAILGIGPIARSLYSPAMVFQYRELNFRTAFVADITGKILATGIAIAVLLGGGGYWAIVVNMVASSVIPTLLSYALAPYRPALSLKRFADFSSFTGWFTASQVIAALNWQYDRVFLGYHLDKATLGRYTVASDLSVMPTQSLIGPAMRPVMAAFSTIAHDTARLRSAFRKAARLTMLVAAPAGLGIALTADLIVAIMLGPNWGEAAAFLRLLALSVVLTAYYQPLYALCLALDRPNLIFRVNVLDLVFRVVVTTAAFYLYGLYGLLYGRVVASVFQFAVSAFYVRRLTRLGLAQQVGNLWQVAASCLIMVAVVLSVQALLAHSAIGLIGGLAATALAGALIYVGCIFAFGFRLRALM